MMIVMKASATEDQVQAVIDRIESCGARAHPSRGEEVTVIGEDGRMNEAAGEEIDFAEGTAGGIYIVNTRAAPHQVADRYRLGGRIATIANEFQSQVHAVSRSACGDGIAHNR